MNRRYDCDFDSPESPTDRIVRGITIALDGAEAAIKAGIDNDFVKELKEIKYCARALETVWKIRRKYADEIEAIESSGGEVIINTGDDPKVPTTFEIECIKDKIKKEYPFSPELIKKEAAKYSK